MPARPRTDAAPTGLTIAEENDPANEITLANDTLTLEPGVWIANVNYSGSGPLAGSRRRAVRTIIRAGTRAVATSGESYVCLLYTSPSPRDS